MTTREDVKFSLFFSSQSNISIFFIGNEKIWRLNIFEHSTTSEEDCDVSRISHWDCSQMNRIGFDISKERDAIGTSDITHQSFQKYDVGESCDLFNTTDPDIGTLPSPIIPFNNPFIRDIELLDTDYELGTNCNVVFFKNKRDLIPKELISTVLENSIPEETSDGKDTSEPNNLPREIDTAGRKRIVCGMNKEVYGTYNIDKVSNKIEEKDDLFSNDTEQKDNKDEFYNKTEKRYDLLYKFDEFVTHSEERVENFSSIEEIVKVSNKTEEIDKFPIENKESTHNVNIDTCAYNTEENHEMSNNCEEIKRSKYKTGEGESEISIKTIDGILIKTEKGDLMPKNAYKSERNEMSKKNEEIKVRSTSYKIKETKSKMAINIVEKDEAQKTIDGVLDRPEDKREVSNETKTITDKTFIKNYELKTSEKIAGDHEILMTTKNVPHFDKEISIQNGLCKIIQSKKKYNSSIGENLDLKLFQNGEIYSSQTKSLENVEKIQNTLNPPGEKNRVSNIVKSDIKTVVPVNEKKSIESNDEQAQAALAHQSELINTQKFSLLSNQYKKNCTKCVNVKEVIDLFESLYRKNVENTDCSSHKYCNRDRRGLCRNQKYKNILNRISDKLTKFNHTDDNYAFVQYREPSSDYHVEPCHILPETLQKCLNELNESLSMENEGNDAKHNEVHSLNDLNELIQGFNCLKLREESPLSRGGTTQVLGNINNKTLFANALIIEKKTQPEMSGVEKRSNKIMKTHRKGKNENNAIKHIQLKSETKLRHLMNGGLRVTKNDKQHFNNAILNNSLGDNSLVLSTRDTKYYSFNNGLPRIKSHSKCNDIDLSYQRKGKNTSAKTHKNAIKLYNQDVNFLSMNNTGASQGGERADNGDSWSCGNSIGSMVSFVFLTI